MIKCFGYNGLYRSIPFTYVVAGNLYTDLREMTLLLNGQIRKWLGDLVLRHRATEKVPKSSCIDLFYLPT